MPADLRRPIRPNFFEKVSAFIRARLRSSNLTRNSRVAASSVAARTSGSRVGDVPCSTGREVGTQEATPIS